MYFVILFYGMNVARSIIEEKTSRVFEVLLATIRPEEMMAGKVIGVGSVGLTQVGIWIIAGTPRHEISASLAAGVSFASRPCRSSSSSSSSFSATSSTPASPPPSAP